jgi:hypothetical protein
MDSFIDIIDWILRIVGFFTIIISFISLFINRSEFDVNVYINRINKSDFANYENAIEYVDADMNGEYLVFMPQGNTNFKNVKYRECIFHRKRFKIKKVLKQFKNINCTNGLIINTYYPCGLPGRILEWEADYGVKGRYIIIENGKDGNVKYGNYLYKYNLLSRFRKLVDWK